MSVELHQMGVAELARALGERKVSAVEASQHHLARIRKHQDLGTFVAVDEELTLAQARRRKLVTWKGTASVANFQRIFQVP